MCHGLFTFVRDSNRKKELPVIDYIFVSPELTKNDLILNSTPENSKHKGSSTPTKMRKTSNRQIQYNVENFDKIHASSASVRNWSSQ